MNDPNLTCEWFTLCNDKAVGIVEHPVLDWVPTCQHHIEWIKEDAEPTIYYWAEIEEING